METLSVLIFVLIVGVVFLLATWSLVRIGLQRFDLVAAPSPRQRWWQRIVLALAGLGLLCIAYGRFIEPFWPAISRVRLASAKLAPGARPVRLVHISDVHSDPAPRLEERLPDIIAAEKPDLIVFTGDSLNSPAGLPVFRQLMTRLAQIAPTYVVKGNWDAWFWSSQNLFGGTGVHELNGQPLQVDVAGTSIWMTGLAVGERARMSAMFDSVPPGALTVFLYHYPDEIYEVAKRKIDLYCAGHTHGGQVALPLYGALVTFSKFGKRFEAGLYQVDETHLYVNRGLGMEGGSAPRVRFFARPEVTVIDIAPKE